MAVSALAGATAAVATSGMIGARAERAKLREAHRHAADRVAQELVDVLKAVALQPKESLGLLPVDERASWGRRMIIEVDALGPVRRRRIRRQLRNLLGEAALRRLDEIPPDAATPRDRYGDPTVGWDAAWVQRQLAAGRDEQYLFLSGDLVTIAQAIEKGDQRSLDQAWTRADAALRCIGFWLGWWGQWRRALRR